MRNATSPTIAGASPPDRLSAGHHPGRPSRQACLIAGISLLLMSVLAGFGYFVAIDGPVTPGDATATATDITASADLFRLGILSLFAVIALDVVVAWALYRVFRPVHRTWSMAAGVVRVLYAGVYAVATAQLVGAVRLLESDSTAAGDAGDLHGRALARIEAFHTIWDVGLILFGIHLLVIAVLTHRSGFLPRFLGVLLAVAGAGYLFDSLAAALTSTAVPEVSTVTFVGEFLLALWLSFGSRRVSTPQPPIQPTTMPTPGSRRSSRRALAAVAATNRPSAPPAPSDVSHHPAGATQPTRRSSS
jgi:Domain of unknown function (DUF4386)